MTTSVSESNVESTINNTSENVGQNAFTNYTTQKDQQVTNRHMLNKKEQAQEEECKQACLAIFNELNIAKQIPVSVDPVVYVYWLNLLLSAACDKLFTCKGRFGCSPLHRMSQTDKRELVLFHSVQQFYKYLLPLFQSDDEDHNYTVNVKMTKEWKTSVFTHASKVSLYDEMIRLVQLSFERGETYEIIFST